MFSIALIIIISKLIIISKSDKLIFAGIHFTPGLKSPFKQDIKGKDLLGINWSSKGELTSSGKKMNYLLGVKNRQRYINKYKLLSETLDPNELLVYHSDDYIAKQSVYLLLQGLYQFSSNKEDILNLEKLDIKMPPIDTNFAQDNIKDNYLNICESACFINNIHFYLLDFKECQSKIDNLLYFNKKKPSLIKLEEKFNLNYNISRQNLSFFSIYDICEVAITDYIERKNMNDFYKNNNITENEFIKDCYEVLNIYSRDYLLSDNDLLLFYNSFITKTIINYMKERIDIDINGDNDSNNPSPKMVIISGQNTTLSAQELFFIKFFGSESYRFPIYDASQISLEISRKEVTESSRKYLKYSDYTISEYFNDRLVFNMNFSRFLEKIGKINLWDDSRLNTFCQLNKKKEDDIDKIIAIIILAILIVILFVIIIILIKKKHSFDLNCECNCFYTENNKLRNQIRILEKEIEKWREYKNYTAIVVDDSQRSSRKFRENININEKQNIDLTNKLNNKIKELENKNNEVNLLENKITKLEQENKNLKEKNQNLDKELLKIKNDIENNNIKFQKEKDDLTKINETLNITISELQQLKKENTEKIEKYEEEIKVKEKESKNNKDKINELINDNQKKEEKIIELIEEQKKIKLENGKLNNRIKELEYNNKDLSININEKEKSIEELKEKEINFCNKIDNLNNIINEKDNLIYKLKQEFNNTNKEVNEMKKNNEYLIKQKEILTKENDKLKKDIEDLNRKLYEKESRIYETINEKELQNLKRVIKSK